MQDKTIIPSSAIPPEKNPALPIRRHENRASLAIFPRPPQYENTPHTSQYNEIIFIDQGVEDYQTLIAGTRVGMAIHVIDSKRDGVLQITDILKQQSDINALHIISHGNVGCLALGNSILSTDTLDHYQSALLSWQQALGDNADILIYGCEIANGPLGEQFIQQLAHHTGVNVAASSNLTGNSEFNGDWNLGYQTGLIKTRFPFCADIVDCYPFVLVLEDFSSFVHDTHRAPSFTYNGFTYSINNPVIVTSDLREMVYQGDPYLEIGGSLGTSIFSIASADGSEFSLTSLTIRDQFNLGVTYSVSGWRDGEKVTADVLHALTGTVSNTNLFLGSLDINFRNIDTIYVSGTDVGFSLEDWTYGAAIINMAPFISIDNTSLAYTENAAAIQIDAAATLSDADGDADWDGGTLRIQITDNHEAADRLSIIDDAVGTIRASGTDLLNNETVIGTLSAAGGTVTNDTVLTITFNANATNTLVQQVIRAIHYDNTSDDPGTADRTITFTATDKHAAAAIDTRGVAITAVNDSPTLTAFNTSPTFTEGGAVVSLFSGTTISAVESSDNIISLSLTVTNVTDGTNEVLSIDDSSISLTNGNSVVTATNIMATDVSVIGSTATITVTKAGGITTAQAQTLVNAITYNNTSQDPTAANRVITLTSIQDSGGTANGGVDTTALSTASTVTVVPVNDAPTLTASGNSPTFSQGGSAVDLFNNVTASTIESGQTLEQLTITVTNVTDGAGANEFLFIDDENVALSNANSGTTTASSISYSVLLAAGTATVTLIKTGMSTAAVQTLIDGLTYSNTSMPPSNADRVVTITSLKDNGGTVNGGVDTATLSIMSTVTVVPSPYISSATYDATTGTLVVIGDNIQANGGGADIDASKLTLSGEGGDTYTLTDTANVNRDSTTQFTVILSADDRAALNQIINKSGLTSTSGATYNLAAADNWNTAVTSVDTADTTGNGITVSNVPAPAITSSTYDAGTGVLIVTGTGFLKLAGANNDIAVSKLTFLGEGSETYTLTTADVDITSGTSFAVTLNAADQAAVNQFFNKNGAASTSGATYNLAAAENWAAGADPAVTVADLAGNGIIVSNVAIPAIISSTYDAGTGVLVVTGTGFLKKEGVDNDIDASKFTFTGEGGASYTLTDTANVEITSGTTFMLTLSANDKAAVNQIINRAGTISADATAYNLAAAEDWATGADMAVNVADLTGNWITATLPAPTSSGGAPTPAATPPTTTAIIDGALVTTTTQPDGAILLTVPVIVSTWKNDPTTLSNSHADIPVVANSQGSPVLTVSLPVGIGLSAAGQPSVLSKQAASFDLIERIQQKTTSGSESSQAMTGRGQEFLDSLASDEFVNIHTLELIFGSKQQPDAPIIITGSDMSIDSKQLLIIDGRNLPVDTVLQLDDVAFAAIIGAVRVVGGKGKNFVIGDNHDQIIILGADDDILYGGGGNNTVGSLGGDDFVSGGAGDDIIFGGSGDDILSGGAGNNRLNGGLGFDVALQEGRLADYQIEIQGHEVLMTNSNGELDSLIDIELVRFDSGPSLAIAHSAAEAAAHYLAQTWLGRDLMPAEGNAIQNWRNAEVDDIVAAFLSLPETVDLRDKTSSELLAGRENSPNILQLDVAREFIGSNGNDQGYLPFGLAMYVDGGKGFDVLRIPGSRKDVHLEFVGDTLELTRLSDGAMLSLKNAEAIAFDSGETVVFAHDPTAGILGRLFHGFFNRDATSVEWQLGQEALAAQVSPDIILSWFQERAGLDSLSDTDYIQTLFTRTLGRQATETELNEQLFRLNNEEVDQAWLAVEVAASDEALSLVGNVMLIEGWI